MDEGILAIADNGTSGQVYKTYVGTEDFYDVAVLPLGDNQYEIGTLTDFQTIYEPSWGRMKTISRPVPGNHEYGYTGTGTSSVGASSPVAVTVISPANRPGPTWAAAEDTRAAETSRESTTRDKRRGRARAM